jgi:hypothetical protein
VKNRHFVLITLVTVFIVAVNSSFAFANPIIQPKGFEYSANLYMESIVNLIILSPLLWGLSRIFIGKNVKFSIAVLTVLLGTIASTLILNTVLVAFTQIRFGFLFVVINLAVPLSSLIVIWSVLIRHFLNSKWLKALAISVIMITILSITTYCINFYSGTLYT